MRESAGPFPGECGASEKDPEREYAGVHAVLPELK